MNNAEYHADRTAISKSGLDLIHKSPAHFRWAKDNPRDETPAMRKGSLVHCLVLEPHVFGNEYALLPPTIKLRRGKEYEKFLADVGDRVVLTAAEHEEADRIATAVRANPAALKIIENATAIEQSVFAEDFATGVKVKCRPDIRANSHIYDLKTTRNANARSFAYSVRSFRYHVQAAFYMDVCQAAGIEVEHFGFIAVDTEAMPYQCTVFHRLSAESIEQGRAEYREDLELYRQCLERDEWPGYPNEYDELDMGGSAYDTTEMKEAA